MKRQAKEKYSVYCGKAWLHRHERIGANGCIASGFISLSNAIGAAEAHSETWLDHPVNIKRVSWLSIQEAIEYQEYIGDE